MGNLDVTQIIAEVVAAEEVKLDNSQVVTEVLAADLFQLSVSQVLVEIICFDGVPVGPVDPNDLTGIYVINPNKLERHDSYYGNNERKIPNPTVRTALIGD